MLDTMNGWRLAPLAAVLAALALPTTAMGQCDAGADAGVDPLLEGTLSDSFPADQGTDVPLNSPIRLRYYGRVPDPPVVCVQSDSLDAPCLAGAAAAVGDEVVWQPRAGVGGALLEPGRRYFVTYQETGRGSNRVTFVTGRGVAPERLAFGGVTEVDADSASGNGCDPDAADITVKFDRATAGVVGLGDTPWPDIDIEYVIYETRGPGIAGPRERDRVRLQRSGSLVVSGAQRTFRLSGAEASGPVCFNVQALDPHGRADGNAQEQCVNPGKGNHFEGCAARPGRASYGGLGAIALALTAAWSRRPRRRR